MTEKIIIQLGQSQTKPLKQSYHRMTKNTKPKKKSQRNFWIVEKRKKQNEKWQYKTIAESNNFLYLINSTNIMNECELPLFIKQSCIGERNLFKTGQSTKVMKIRKHQYPEAMLECKSSIAIAK